MRFCTKNYLQIIQSVCLLVFFSCPFLTQAQTNYIPYGSKDYNLLDRLEIKTRLEGLSYSTVKPYPRKQVVEQVELIDSLLQANNGNYAGITATDAYNIQSLLMGNSEWSKPRDYYLSKKPVLKNFFVTKPNVFELKNKDFFFVFNPLIQFSYGKENGNNQALFQNTRGISMRGMISKKIGFNLYLTENQERDPLYVQAWTNQFKAVPGAGFYKDYKTTGVDYFDARGSVSWNVARFIDMQFGYDKNSIGAGYRSLLLSDFGNSALFFKINTRIWKFNYENLFMELFPQHDRGGNELFSRKYARFNHLSINATPWLNVGLFEGVIFGRKDHFDFQYMLPVMFLRPAESNNGSADNAVIGLDAKANIAKKFQVYGQLLVDEFKASEVFSKRGWWGDKIGYQLGVKYIDIFGLKNVDLQLETNRIRPYTYAHNDSVANYTHYNQPLAHPLGANLQEYIAILKAQPFKHLYITGKFIHYYQGLDSAGINFGSNIFIDYNSRPRDYGFNVGSGDKATCNLFSLGVTYEVKENIFFDVTALRRTYNVASSGAKNTTVFSVGFRWNLPKREFDF